MRKFQILAFFILAIAGTVAGQCPGPAVRTALLNLQRANTTLTTNTVTGPRAGQFGLTDSCGNQRYQYYTRVLDSVDCICCNPITTPGVGAPPSAFVKICDTDSIFYIDWKRDPIFLGEALTITQILDSLQNDTAFFNNWYTRNDTTTDLLRTASVLRSAWWRTVDSLGFLRWSNRPDGLDGPQFSLYQDSIVIDADTIIWRSTYNPTLQFHDLTASGTYFYADSLKVVGLGQFPAFPSLAFDGTEKGFFYEPNGGGVYLLNGDGTSANQSNIRLFQTGLELVAATDATFANNGFLSLEPGSVGFVTQFPAFTYERSGFFSIEQSGVHQVSLREIAAVGDTNKTTTLFLGESNNVSTGYLGRRAFGLSTQLPNDTTPTETYYWLLNFLPNDTTENAISFYNRAYYFPNDRPSNTLNDTSVIVWIGDGTNAGKHPQFVPLPGAGSTVNWYNSNGTTTENTRIADVLETATWRSDNVTLDGIVPFRFELAGSPANEPEMMTWQFDNGDSLLLYRSDQEIVFNSNTSTVFRSDVSTQLNAPTTSMSNNVGGFLTLNDAGTLSHSAATMHYNLSNGSSGTSQVELLITGPFTPITLTAAQTLNFRVSVRARCTNVGNGVGITSGDSYASWNVGCIKLVGTTTSIVGTVQQVVADQADTGMSTAVTTIDADDTDESLRIRFTPPSTAGTTTVIAITATVEITQ